MFVQESKKVFANVCFQRFAVGWVKPCNIAFSIFPNVFNIFNIFFDLTLKRAVFSEVFSETWDQSTLHCLSKKGYYSIVRIASVRYVEAEDCNTRLHETLST